MPKLKDKGKSMVSAERLLDISSRRGQTSARPDTRGLSLPGGEEEEILQDVGQAGI